MKNRFSIVAFLILLFAGLHVFNSMHGILLLQETLEHQNDLIRQLGKDYYKHLKIKAFPKSWEGISEYSYFAGDVEILNVQGNSNRLKVESLKSNLKFYVYTPAASSYSKGSIINVFGYSRIVSETPLAESHITVILALEVVLRRNT